jgi:PAS domain S-box-containing protein
MEQFFDAATDGIVFLDRDYCITFLNRRAREILAPSGDVIGTNLFESYPSIVYEGSPYEKAYRGSMERGEQGDFEAFYPDPLNLWLRVLSYPTDNGIMIFFRDVTEEKHSAEILRNKTDEAERQHAELETIYATAPIGLALFDLEDYHYLRLNDRQAAFFGMKPEEIVGKTLIHMAPNVPGLRELFDQVARGEPVINQQIEGTLVNDPSEHRYWNVSYFPVYGTDGNIQAITAASQEITHQKKAEKALIQSEKLAAVGRLASSIAHEINNPLEAVTNLLYLARNNTDVDQIHHFLGSAEIELRRVAAITNQTLRFHKQSTRPQAITATQLFESVLSIYQGRVANSGLEISQRLRANQPVRCFEGEIRQVLSNLINNALDAVKPSPTRDGHLILRSRAATDWSTGEQGIVITVADTGAGMSSETLTKLFDPFFTTKGITGTGLGLWVSKEIVDRHNGHLRVRSSQSPQHRGTVFTLFLPFDAVVR